MELELLIITNLVAANAMPNTAPGWSGNAFGSCAPFLRSLLSLPPQVSCLLIVSDNVINKNSKCGGDGRVNGLAKRRARLARRTEANFRPRGQTLLSHSLASGHQAAQGEGDVRQARAAQASVHVPDNMASKRQLTTLGYYGNSPPPPVYCGPSAHRGYQNHITR